MGQEGGGTWPPPWRRRIIIDPGHGGHHKGGIGRIGSRTVYEKEVTIQVAVKLEKLIKADRRFDVRLTRREDVYVGLKERTDRATAMKGDLFVSLHCNAVEAKGGRSSARGFEIWTWKQDANLSTAGRAIENLENDDPGTRTSENNKILTTMMKDALESNALQSRRFASAMHDAAGGDTYLRTHDRGMDSAHFKVLEVYDMPSILVELGFMTNVDEVRMLFSDSFQQIWAQTLYRGIVKYYEQTDPTFPRR
ncbi:hypothetical protein BH09SUM1_BH09SUM1_25150 [soil metagenome]